MNLSDEISVAVAKVSPPVAVIVASAAGWGPQQWMYAATTVYVVLQSIYLGWKGIREYRASRKDSP